MKTLELTTAINNYKLNSNVFTLNALMKKVGTSNLCNKGKQIWSDFLETL